MTGGGCATGASSSWRRQARLGTTGYSDAPQLTAAAIRRARSGEDHEARLHLSAVETGSARIGRWIDELLVMAWRRGRGEPAKERDGAETARAWRWVMNEVDHGLDAERVEWLRKATTTARRLERLRPVSPMALARAVNLLDKDRAGALLLVAATWGVAEP